MNPDITVSIIVHSDYTHIHRALTSLLASTQRPMTLCITINTPITEETRRLQSQFPQATYIFNEQPKGFAVNHNAILRRAGSSFMLLLNDDVFVPVGMVDALIDALETHPQIALVTPLVLNPDGTRQLTAFNDPDLLRMLYKISGLGHLTRPGTRIRRLVTQSPLKRYVRVASLREYAPIDEVPVAVGVAMCVRRAACDQAGFMDEDTRVYVEEFGWQLRLRRAGWKIAVVSTTSITHFNVEQALRGWKLAEHRKGLLNYFCRYRPAWEALLIRGAIIASHSLRGAYHLVTDREQATGDFMAVRLALSWRPTE